jgi:hypothetical protein
MVEGFTGLPGSGKTYWLSKLGLDALAKGLPVYANFHLEGANKFSDLKEVFFVRKGVILVDEINLVCPSRWWNKFPPQLAYFWSQTRKFQLDIYWSAQHIDRVDKIIREISNWVWTINRLPFGFFIARMYIPEHITKEKRKHYTLKFFKLNSKVYTKYNTFELIELPINLINK